MIRHLVQVVCDRCGTVQEFEVMYHGQFGSVCTTNERGEARVGDMIELHGWQTKPLEGGGKFRREHVCPTCWEYADAAKMERQER